MSRSRSISAEEEDGCLRWVRYAYNDGIYFIYFFNVKKKRL